MLLITAWRTPCIICHDRSQLSCPKVIGIPFFCTCQSCKKEQGTWCDVLSNPESLDRSVRLCIKSLFCWHNVVYCSTSIKPLFPSSTASNVSLTYIKNLLNNMLPYEIFCIEGYGTKRSSNRFNNLVETFTEY